MTTDDVEGYEISGWQYRYCRKSTGWGNWNCWSVDPPKIPRPDMEFRPVYINIPQDAKLGRILMKYIDRLNDPDECDPLEQIVSELSADTLAVIDAANKDRL